MWLEGISQLKKNKRLPSQIEPATCKILKQSVNQQHHCVTLSQSTCQVIILIQFTSTHTAPNLILPILNNKTLNQGLKQKNQDNIKRNKLHLMPDTLL